MKVFGLDPGPVESALVVINEDFSIDSHYYESNDEIELILNQASEQENQFACEFIQSYGMSTGKSTFFTCLSVGRFQAFWGEDTTCFLYARPTIKGHLVGGVRGVKDRDIRNALKQRFGLSKKGHPLAGISRHKWDALAVAVTHLDCIKNGAQEFMTYE